MKVSHVLSAISALLPLAGVAVAPAHAQGSWELTGFDASNLTITGESSTSGNAAYNDSVSHGGVSLFASSSGAGSANISASGYTVTTYSYEGPGSPSTPNSLATVVEGDEAKASASISGSSAASSCSGMSSLSGYSGSASDSEAASAFGTSPSSPDNAGGSGTGVNLGAPSGGSFSITLNLSGSIYVNVIGAAFGSASAEPGLSYSP